MKLEAVEASLGIQFPKLFHTIDQSGMMDYLIHTTEWDEDKFTAGRENAGIEDFFGQSMGDCMLIAFENIQSAYDELYECLNSDLDVYPEHQSINSQYRLVPFVRKISGDQYCFLYEDGEDEPRIVLYGHDTGDVDLWANSFEEFVYFQIVEEAADGEHEIHSDYIKAHILWLNDEHQQLLAKAPIQDIWEQLPEPQEINIWV